MCSDRLVVGAIAGSKGVRGHFKVKLFSESLSALTQYGPLEIDDGRSLLLATKSLNSKGLVVASAAGIDSREAADALKGMTLSVQRALLPNLADNEVYHADLLGLQAFHEKGTLIGIVIALHNFGGGEIVEIKPEGEQSVMLPFEGDSLVSIDFDNKKVILAPPVGLINDKDGKN